ncbi:MAG TPA: substrate-binding domain-containing protein [Streptosporangiaceae bacterium]|nr:substrate-binding domain-containing protein [Streptosporangiaceae bacterium]
MHWQAVGVISRLYTAVDTRGVITGLLVGFGLAVASAAWGLLSQVFSRHRVIGWDVLYDEAVNQGDPSAQPQLPQGPGGQSPITWEILYKGGNGTAPPVTNGSLALVEVRNVGREPIREADFGEHREFAVRFPGRRVVNYKVRENALYHKLVQEEQEPPVPGAEDYFTLPALQMNYNEGFKLLVLLESDTAPQPGLDGEQGQVLVEGSILGGRFVRLGQGQRRKWVALSVSAAIVLAMALSAVAGVRLASRALSPSPVCAAGSVAFKGSTAFEPIVKEVAAEYEQYCPGAHITVRAIGSVQGLSELENSTSPSPLAAMYDGQPPGGPPGPPYVGQPVGVVVFAVVGNTVKLPPSLFAAGPGGGMTTEQIAQAFNDPGVGIPAFVPVGRSGVSGTREAFARDFLQGNDSAEQAAGPCPAPAKDSVCLEDTTMDLLGYVNRKWDSIGYAEADALPFFPQVGAISINGYAPTRANALSGHYPFLVTEHLYTKGEPQGLTADFIDFLKSSTVTDQLRRTSLFISCADLAGSKLQGDCSH